MKKLLFLLTCTIFLAFANPIWAQCPGGSPQCQILIEMHDSFGDGWNNGQLSVYQGATLRGAVTLESGSSGETQVSVCSDTIVFVWSVGWYDSEISFVVTDEGGDTLLAVSNASDYNDGDTIAVVMHQCPTCPRVSGLHVVTRTHNQLGLAWNPGNATSWQVEYGAAGFTLGNGTTMTVTTPEVTLSGLDSAHWYDVYVTSICGSETTTPRFGHYSTLCGENTCDVMFWMRDYGWNGWNGNGIYIYQRGGLIDFVTMGNGYLDSIAVPLCHDSITLIWHQVGEDYDAQFMVYDLSHRMLAEGENYDLYDGDTIASALNNCNACPYPTWVDVGSIDTTHATLIWSSTSAPGYILKFYYQGHNGDSLMHTVTTTDTFYTFSYLQPNTNYFVQVASLCGTDTSGWNEIWISTNAVWMPIIYVSNSGDDDNTGSNWSNALASINMASSLAQTLYYQYGATPEIWVAQGSYYSNFYLSPGMHVYGGLVGDEPANYDMSLRDLSAHPTTIYYSYGVVNQYEDYTASTAAWVDGFTFTSATYTIVNLRSYGALRNCVITGNTVSSSYIMSVDCSHASDNSWASLVNCSIVDNVCTSSYTNELVRLINARAENCLIARNTVRTSVVGLNDSSVLSHCDVVCNTSNNSSYAAVTGNSYSTGSNSRLENSIVWGNTYYNNNHLTSQVSGILEGYYSAVEGGITGYGNINLAAQNTGSTMGANYPKFVAPPTNLQLNGGSACINAAIGTPATTTDIEGNPRVYGSAADMGCYEYQGVDICGPVTYAHITEVTSYSARVVWGSEYTAYIVYYRQQNGTTWDSMTVNASTNSYQDNASGMMLCSTHLSGLTGLTTYQVRLKSVCDGSISEAYELTFTTVCPDVTGYIMVGDSTTTVNSQGNYFPTNTFYNYSATQQIYLASEIGSATTINQLDFFYTYSNPVTRRLKIFLGHTSMNAFASTSDVIAESQLTLVYNGNYTFSNSPTMNSIQLDVPFNYNGTDNLVLAVIDSTGSYQYSANKFLTFSAPNRSLYRYQDGSYLDFGNTSFYMGSYCNVLHLPGECDLTACPTATFNILPGVTSATVNWAVSGTAEMQYRPVGDSNYTTVTLGTGTTTLTGLVPFSSYEVRMRNICGADDTSNWISRTFSTLPPNVDRLYVKTAACGDASGSSWENAMGDLETALRMTEGCYSVYGTVCDIWVAEGTYYGDTNRSYAFGMVPGVRIYGGLIGNEPENYNLNLRNLSAHQTILDGRGQRQVVNLNTNTIRQRNAALNGIIIQNGNHTSYGGGLYAYRLDLQHCIVRNCVTTGYYGGGAYLYYGTASNCLFYGNYCPNYGGGLYAYTSDIDHTDIINNSAYYTAGLYCSGYGSVTNSIVWGNHRTNGGSDYVSMGSMTFNHCAADCNLTDDSTNLRLAYANMGDDDSLHVRFASPEDHDYRLMEGSACIDMGSATTTDFIDLRGQSRLYGTATDIGCYEFNDEHFCIRPTQVTVGEVTAFSAMVGWNGENDTVVLEYALAADSQWTAVTVVGHQHLLMSLAFDTRYMVRLKSICGGEQSMYTDILSFTTACGAGGHGTTVGDPVDYLTTEGNHLPINAYYCYSYTQSLYDANELGNTASTIDTLYWQYVYETPDTRSLTIYLGETDKTQFLSNTDRVASSGLTQVFSGAVTFNNDNTWFAIPLQNSFSYSGTQNLVIAVIDNTGTYLYSGYRFATHSTDVYKSTYVYSDGTSYTLDGNYSFNRVYYRPNLQIPSTCIDVTCPTPGVTVTEVTPSTATFRTVSMGPLQMQYRKAGSNEYIEIMPSDTVTITGLLQNTRYELRARTICSAGDTSMWRNLQFTTPLMQIDRIYVKVAGSGTTDGTSWENATADFAWALNTAGAIHDAYNIRPQVWVAQGTYYGDTTATSAFVMEPGVDVYGGFQGNEPANFNLAARDCDLHPTILDGQGARRVLNQTISITGDSIIWDGFHITNGFSGNENGGGAYLRHGGILANCTVTNCHNTNYGGGVYNYYGTVRNCLLTGDSSQYGGAIYNAYGTVKNCTLTGSKGYYSGGLYNEGTAINCLIANNTANYYGGLYQNSGYMNNCHVVDNLSTSSSNLNYCYGTIYNTLFWGNRHVTNTNAIQAYGGGTYNHCAFERNYPSSGTMVGCIILDSQNEGNLMSPRFVRPAAGAGTLYAVGNDWTLQEGSILIDRGYTDSTMVLPPADLNGNSRVQNGRVDIGCYESSNLGIIMPDYTNGIIYVTSTGAGLQDGSSWANAMNDINTAILYSSLSNYPQVWVAEGTYYGDLSSANAFISMAGVHVYGGFEGNEPTTFSLSERNAENHQTILNGMGARRVLYQPTAYSSDSSVWDGFIITGGRVTGYNDYGGGVYLRQGGILANCTVTNCRSNQYGGGIYSTSGIVRNCTITADSASEGGGLYIYNGTTLSNCIITANQAYYYGGLSSYNSYIYNCLIANNTANYSAGVYLSSSNMFNCDVVANLSTTSSNLNYSYYSNLYNSIFWSNHSYNNPLVLQQLEGNNYSYYYNCAFESEFPVSGTKTECVILSSSNTGLVNSPKFVQPAYGAGTDHANGCDWTLQDGSILIDRGSTDTTVGIPVYDLAGNPRPQNGRGDIGLYETPYNGFDLPEYTDGIVYVTATGSGLQDGTSWANAMNNIRDAVLYALLTGSQRIWVAEGTYYGDTAAAGAFTITEGVNLYGGFAGNEPATYDLSLRDFAAHPTILDGQHANRVLNQVSSYSTYTVVDGFIIQNGLVTNQSGAGVLLRSGGRLRNCIVQNNVMLISNSNSYYGVGVYVYNSPTYDTIMDHCIVRNNISQNLRTGNNVANCYGGGIFINSANQCYITNCEIYGNSSYRYGGIYAYYTKLYNTVVSNNQSTQYAGVYLYYSSMYNCVVANNTATSSNGGVYGSYSSYIYNSIIWGNKVNYLPDNLSGSASIYNTAVEDGYSSGANILELANTNDGTSGMNNYVRFMDPGQNNFHLHPASHCLDYGDSTYSHLATDLDGNPRIMGGNIDLGVYECENSTTCPSPLNLRSLAITGTSATFAWTPQGNETQWLFTIQGANGTLDSNITLSDTTLTVSGLSLNRNYTCYVRAICGSEYSIRSPLLTITTLCDSTTLTPLSAFTSFLPADSTLIFNNGVDFSWSALPEATSYDFYLWKGNAMPTTPTISGLTTTMLNGYSLPNFERGAYYHWKVVAWNECINRTSPVHVLRVNPLPDLHVTSVTHSAPVANQPMTVTWTVKNDGEGATPQGVTWNDYIWLVSDVDVRLYDPNDRLLATIDNLQGLNPGESYTNSVTINLPEDFIGNYYLFVFTDQVDAYSINFSPTGGVAPDPYTPSVTGTPYPYLTGYVHHGGNLPETNENDNFFYKTINILPPPSPDLVVTHISHPINAFSNSDITVGWTVTNAGQAIVSPKWYDKVYIQMGNEFNMAEALLLATVPHFAGFDTVNRVYVPGSSDGHGGGWVDFPVVLGSPLEVDSSYSASATVHIPIQYSGTYNIFVVTDANEAIYESIYEGNNVGMSQQTIEVVMSPLADLTVTSVSIPSPVSPRCSYPVSWTVTNAGAAATERASWIDALYLSTTPTYDASTAIFLKNETHNGVIGIDSGYTVNTTITMPTPLSGPYYLIVRTDYQDVIFEYLNEDNNTGASTTPAQVLLPDLIVSSVQFENSLSVGDTLHIQAYIKNVGQGIAYGYVNTRFNTGGTWIDKGLQCNLAPGDSALVTCLLKQPCVSTTQGELIIQSANVYQMQESNENNNNKTIPFTINRPDLTATAINFADTGWSGTTLPVSFNLSNTGSVAVNDSVELAMYISTSSTSYTATAANRVMNSRDLLYIASDSSILLNKNITLPNGIQGDYYLHLVLDVANIVCESNELNNVVHSTSPIHVNLSPYPDLIVRNLVVPDTLSVGQTVPFEFNLINQGIAAAQGNLMTKIFMSLGSTYNSAPLVEVASLQQTVNIAVDDTLPVIVSGMIPTNSSAGFYYFYAVTDYTNALYEHTGENNNTVRSSLTFVQLYPLDLQIDSISGPSSVDWGQRVTYTMTVTNNTLVSTSAQQWVDHLYITEDGAIRVNMSHEDQNHSQPLLPGESYQVNFEVTIPYGSPSTLYLVGICDFNRSNPDINLVNNQLVKPITVNAVPTPDLQVSDVDVIGDVVSGQPFHLAYTVTNVSETPVALQRWADRISLSYVASLNSTSQQLLLTSQEMALPSGGSYRDTVEVTIPLPNSGMRYLLVQANAQLNFYETVQENNMVAVPMNIMLPPPGDLIVSRIAKPDTVVSCTNTTFQWTVSNIGTNDISGRGLSSLLYLSSDDAFSSNDRLLGRVNVSQINLTPGDTLAQQLIARISGVSEGNYYLIVKTDVRNAFYEDDENNNSTVTMLPFYVKVRELPFNTPIVDTLYNGEPNDYKINVGNHRNETVRIHLESNDSLHGAVNMVYVSHNKVGDNLSYNFSTIGQYTANPEIYIPSTRAGNYGVSLYGSVPSGSLQVVTVTADILPFELRSINPTEGGNTGKVTIEMTGSRFRPDMKVWMLHQGDTLFADTLIYSSYYQAFARFDLKGADTGYYSMGVLNYCEGEAMLTDVFHVTEESPDGLLYHMVFPTSPRVNRTISMMLEFGNTGNVDIVAPVLEVQSVGGTYIALTPEGLADHATTLLLPLTIEGEPEGLLRPGTYGTVTIYGYTAGSLVFAIKQVQ